MEILRKRMEPQYLVCFIVNVLSFTYGVIVNLYAPKQIFNENILPRWGDIPEEESFPWITRCYFIGGFLGALLLGYLANAIGRKKVLITITVCFLISHLINMSTGYLYYLYIGQLIRGFGSVGVFIIVPTYISEISEDDIRRVLCSYFNLSLNCGVLFSIVLKRFFPSWWQLEVLSFLFLLMFLKVCFWLPESPVYSLLKNRTDDAKNSLIKLRKKSEKLIENELQNISSTMGESRISSSLIVGIVLMALRQLSCINWMTYTTEKFFRRSEVVQNYGLYASIITALFPVMGAMIATTHVKKFGQKCLLLISCIGMAVTVVWSLALLLITEENHLDSILTECIHWVSTTAYAFYIVSFHLGFGSVTWILLPEIFTPRSRSPGIAICVFVFWALYVLDFYVSFQFVDFRITLLAINGVLAAIFILYFIPEMKERFSNF